MFPFSQILTRITLVTLIWGVCSVAHAVVVLQYHHVSEDTPASTSVTPERFAEHMSYLQEHEFNIITMDQFLQFLESGDALPAKSVLITFDDGYESIYRNAWPLLKEKDWPFTLFINTEPHDQGNSRYISWKQLKEMADHDGVTIGNHSVSHPHMPRKLPDESQESWLKRMRAEVVDAQKRIDEQLGEQPKVFAYPYGEYNPEIQKLMEELGFYAFGQQSGAVGDISERTVLPRYPFGGDFGGREDFITKVNSKAMPLTKVEVLDRRGRALKDPLLPEGEYRPELRLFSDDPALLKRIQCFATRQGSIPIEVKDGYASVRSPGDMPVGRSRYNCTASAQAGGFYWYSQGFMRKRADGTWYSE